MKRRDFITRTLLLANLNTKGSFANEMAKPKIKAVLNVLSVNGEKVTVDTIGSRPSPGAKITHWQVFWGDGSDIGGNILPTFSLDHSYPKLSTDKDYNITLSIADNKGAFDNTVQIVRITNLPPINTNPNITLVSPTTGPVATVVTILGTYFGATQGTSTVRFNGSLASIGSWSDTKIVCVVPSGASTGNVVVRVNGIDSPGIRFTVTGTVNDFGGLRPQIYSGLYGGQTVGGRGPGGATVPVIIIVNTLANNGLTQVSGNGTRQSPFIYNGGFRAANEDLNQPRFVLSEVSGYIQINRDITIRNNYQTIMGQTAPNDGITLRAQSSGNLDSAGGINVQADEQVFQHFRVRPGDFGPNLIATVAHNGFQIGYDPGGVRKPKNILLDHISCSWTGGKVFQVGYFDQSSGANNGPGNICFWKCLGSEALWRASNVTPGQAGGGSWGNPPFSFEPSSYVLHLVGTGFIKISFMNGLLVHNGARNPETGDGVLLQFFNNLLFDWGGDPGNWPGGAMALGGSTPQTYNVDQVGNYFITGAGPYPVPVSGGQSFGTLYAADSYDSFSGTKLFQSDNFIDQALFPCAQFHFDGSGPTPWDPRVGAFTNPLGNIAIAAGNSIKNAVLADVGARPLNRDQVDTRIINDVLNKTGAMISSQNSVGGYPALTSQFRAITLPANPCEVDPSDPIGRLRIETWGESDPNFGSRRLEP